jgi:hypothetical protein
MTPILASIMNGLVSGSVRSSATAYATSFSAVTVSVRGSTVRLGRGGSLTAFIMPLPVSLVFTNHHLLHTELSAKQTLTPYTASPCPPSRRWFARSFRALRSAHLRAPPRLHLTSRHRPRRQARRPRPSASHPALLSSSLQARTKALGSKPPASLQHNPAGTSSSVHVTPHGARRLFRRLQRSARRAKSSSFRLRSQATSLSQPRLNPSKPSSASWTYLSCVFSPIPLLLGRSQSPP